MNRKTMDRREFLKAGSAAALAGAGLAGCSGSSESDKPVNQKDAEPMEPASDKQDVIRDGMRYRLYGKTNVRLSVIGFGGILVMKEPQEEANRIVADAVERGINYFDVAPTYGDAQSKLGPALEPFRKDCFLACKTTERTREGADRELKESRKLLRTDHFDLYQLHAITDVKKDVEAAFRKGGAMEVFTEAKKAGVVRFLGFSAHSEEAALAAMENYDFDSILFPVNYASFLKHGFGAAALEKAHRKGMAILALKAMAKGKWAEGDPRKEQWPKCWYEPITDAAEAEKAVRFTLSQPGVTAAIPPGDMRLFPTAMDLAKRFEPIRESEVNDLKLTASEIKALFPIG